MIQQNTIKSLNTKYFYAVDNLNRILKRNIITITTQRFTDNVIYNKKVSSVFVINNYMLYNQKRFVGGDKPIGHARKVLNAINKHEPKLNVMSPKENPKVALISTKEVNEIPYTEMQLKNSATTVENNVKLPLMRCLASKAMSLLDYITKNSIPANTAINNQNTKTISELLKEAETKNIITYENICENSVEYAKGGNVKLTKRGLELYSKLQENIVDETQNNIKSVQITFVAGMLKIDSNTIITLPKQMHIVVAYDTNNDSYRAIAILTSQKDPKHLILTANQPLSHTDKQQLLRFLEIPLKISKDQLEIHEKATEYIQQEEISKKIMDNRDTFMAKFPLTYNPQGLTENTILNLIMLQEQEQKKQKPPKSLNSFEQELKDKKTAEKLKKAELNKQKQKEDHLKKIEKEKQINNEELD